MTRSIQGYYDRATDEAVVNFVDYGKSRPLPLHLEPVRHSPTGFAWGYLGSGPAQLAFAILSEFYGDERALKYYQAFKEAFIAPLKKDEPFVIEEDKIHGWMEVADPDFKRPAEPPGAPQVVTDPVKLRRMAMATVDRALKELEEFPAIIELRTSGPDFHELVDVLKSAEARLGEVKDILAKYDGGRST